MKSATKLLAGAAASSLAVPRWGMLAPVDDGDLVAEQGRLVEVVGHDDRWDLAVVEHPLDRPTGAGSGPRVERRKRLVEQQHVRIARQRPGERDALALAAGVRAGTHIGQVGDVEPLEQLECAAPALGALDALQGVGDVLPAAEVRKQRVALEQVAAAPAIGVQRDAALGIEPCLGSAAHGSAPRRQQPRDRPQHARLARARGTREREAAAGRHL